MAAAVYVRRRAALPAAGVTTFLPTRWSAFIHVVPLLPIVRYHSRTVAVELQHPAVFPGYVQLCRAPFLAALLFLGPAQIPEPQVDALCREHVYGVVVVAQVLLAYVLPVALSAGVEMAMKRSVVVAVAVEVAPRGPGSPWVPWVPTTMHRGGPVRGHVPQEGEEREAGGSRAAEGVREVPAAEAAAAAAGGSAAVAAAASVDVDGDEGGCADRGRAVLKVCGGVGIAFFAVVSYWSSCGVEGWDGP